MASINIPLIWNDKAIKELNYPDDIQIGLYVWDEYMKRPILITDKSSVEIHKSTSSRKRFASKQEIMDFRNSHGNKNPYKTVYESTAYGLATAIYYLDVFS